MPIVSTLTVNIGGQQLDPQADGPLVRSLEVENEVHKQGIVRLRLAMGQDNQGDWMRNAEMRFTPLTDIKVDVRIGSSRRRLIHAVLTEFKMHFTSDPCTSYLDLVGLDLLEKLKRSTQRRTYTNRTLSALVNEIYGRQQIPVDTSNTPDVGTFTPERDTIAQAHNDLEFLRALGNHYNAEPFVESDPAADADTGHFEAVTLNTADSISTDIRVNSADQTNVRNAAFSYELTGPTAVEGELVDADGQRQQVRVDLRDTLSDQDKSLLGPPDFANIARIDRHGHESLTQLRQRCQTELEKYSWVVVGSGELDTAAYGDLLVPRKKVNVRGISSSFNGTYLVWKVTHTFTRDTHCQRFELRRKLGVQ